jgi:hypothetical protein
MGLKPKLTYATGRNPNEDFSEDDVNSKYPNIPQDRESKKIINGLHQPEDKKEQIIDYWKTQRWWCAAT